MKKNPRLTAEYGKLIDWLINNLSPTEFKPIDNDAVADELKLYPSVVTRGVILLKRNGHLIRAGKNGNLSYGLADSMASVTGDTLYGYHREYYQESEARALAKAAEKTDTVEQHTVFSIPIAPPNEGLGARIAESSKPKTKLQKVLELLGEEEETDTANPHYEERLAAVEQKLDTVLSFFKIANQSLFGGSTNAQLDYEIASIPALPNALVLEGDVPVDPETTRGKLVQLVRAYGVYKNVKYRNIWTWLYGKLNEFYGFNAALHRQNEKEPYLNAVEREGQINNLYSIAAKHLVIPVNA